MTDGLTSISELGWTERTLLTTGFAFDFRPAKTPLGAFKRMAYIFCHFGANIGLILSTLLCYWLLSPQAPLRLEDLQPLLEGLLAELRGSFFDQLYWMTAPA